ncbi:hypothetical protein SPHINGOR109_51162 [Sphingorhabdus sp. 109]|nr:hypothetical protein SPHINGOR109_51162 [Sphingorhabdus sp. 109]
MRRCRHDARYNALCIVCLIKSSGDSVSIHFDYGGRLENHSALMSTTRNTEPERQIKPPPRSGGGGLWF